MKKSRLLFLLPVFFVLLSLLSFQVYAGAGLIAGPTAVNASSNTCVMTTAANTNIIAGDLAVVTSSVSGLATTISSVSDSGGLFTFTKIVSSASFNNVTMFSALSTGTGTGDTITITYSGAVLNRCQGYFIRGALSATPNQTSTNGATSASNTITPSFSSFTPVTGDFVLAAALVQTTSGTATGVNTVPSSPYATLTGIQGAAATNYYSTLWQSPSWVSGSTSGANTFTVTGATALRYDAVIATFWTGPETTTTSLTHTTTTTTAFSTTITNSTTVTSTSYSPTVTSTSFSPTVTLTNTATITNTFNETVTSTSYSPTVTLTSFSPTVTLNETVTQTTFSPTVTLTSYSPTVTQTNTETNTVTRTTFSPTITSTSFSPTVTLTTFTTSYNATETTTLTTGTASTTTTVTGTIFPEAEGQTDIWVLLLGLGFAAFLLVLEMWKPRLWIAGLIGGFLAMIVAWQLFMAPTIVYGSTSFLAGTGIFGIIALVIIASFSVAAYRAITNR